MKVMVANPSPQTVRDWLLVLQFPYLANLENVFTVDHLTDAGECASELLEGSSQRKPFVVFMSCYFPGSIYRSEDRPHQRKMYPHWSIGYPLEFPCFHLKYPSPWL